MGIYVSAPIRIESEMNNRDFGIARWKRFRLQKRILYLVLRSSLQFRDQLDRIKRAQKILVTLTRIAPQRLDDDNLASGFKACRDLIAESLGIDDGSDRIIWRYAQCKGKPHSVNVAIEEVPS